MRNYIFEMALELSRAPDKLTRMIAFGYVLGAMGSHNLEDWEAQYVLNVRMAREYRGISA
jgi:hypothetical protein